MNYDPPGRADALSPRLRACWNGYIRANHQRLLPQYESPFFSLEPEFVPGATRAHVKWFADPAEPCFCIDRGAARRLSDWGVRGRHQLHNEYCEYGLVHRPDAAGAMRAKRVVFTTELREYWTMVAEETPHGVRALVEDVIGIVPSWPELYGHEDPFALSAKERRLAFARVCSGHGDDPELMAAGIPAQPEGTLNRENVLFMTHPINGLDDLIQIVLIGARPYFRETANGPGHFPISQRHGRDAHATFEHGSDGHATIKPTLEPALREEVFRMRPGNERLACRHADPAAAMAAHGAACEGRMVALDDPLGVYMLAFNREAFSFRGEPIPDSWVRFSRGDPGMYQRMEFGPPDDSPAFLSDIVVANGAEEEPLSGGFQVAQQLEVGPLVVVGEPRALREDERIIVKQDPSPIRCHEAAVCAEIRRMDADHRAAHGA